MIRASHGRRLAVLVGAWLATARSAGAEDVPLRAADRAAAVLGLAGSGAPRSPAVTVTQLSPSLAVAYRLATALHLEAAGALTTAAVRTGDAPRSTVTRGSNVVLGASWRGEPRRDLEVAFGLAVGAPLVTVPSGGITASAVAEQADRAALGAAGPRGTWLWARNAAPLFARGSVTHVRGPLRLRLEAAPGLLLSVNRDASRGALVAGLEVAVVTDALAPYVRGDVALSTRALDRDDFAQTGVALGMRAELGGGFVMAELRAQPDGPASLAADGATPWGGTIAGGMRF